MVGVNKFTEFTTSPLTGAGAFLTVDPSSERETIAELAAWRAARDSKAVAHALVGLKQAAADGDNIMPSTIEFALVGGTTGEWADALRTVFGEFRAPTGLGAARATGGGRLGEVAERSRALAGGPPRILVAKPGLDGHSNGAEQIAVAARDSGMEVIYDGIRSTPAAIVATARDEDVDVIGLSILSGSHMELIPSLLDMLKQAGVSAAVVVGGIIPEADQAILLAAGVRRVYTPKDFEISRIMNDIVDLVVELRG